MSKCCENLFSGFVFEDIRSANPPEKKGIYVIKIKKKGKPIQEIEEISKNLIKTLNWSLVGDYMLDRVRRINRIEDCPIIYIGAAGPSERSKNTLMGRYKEFSGRHTVMYPIWMLLYFGWELEFGWEVCRNPKDEEAILKEKYKALHNNKLPALVKQ
ncbi:MAG: hypothetical protein QW304_08820 [Thermoproteota archaeon]